MYHNSPYLNFLNFSGEEIYENVSYLLSRSFQIGFAFGNKIEKNITLCGHLAFENYDIGLVGAFTNFSGLNCFNSDLKGFYCLNLLFIIDLFLQKFSNLGNNYAIEEDLITYFSDCRIGIISVCDIYSQKRSNDKDLDTYGAWISFGPINMFLYKNNKNDKSTAVVNINCSIIIKLYHYLFHLDAFNIENNYVARAKNIILATEKVSYKNN